MNEVASISGPIRARPISNDNDDIGRCVESQEKLERLLPNAVYMVVLGLPILVSLVRGRDGLALILQAVIFFFAAKLIVWGVRGLFLQPSRRIRYDRATKTLRARLQAGEDIAVGPLSWTIGAPGAMGMTRSGKIIILDREHGYVPLQLMPNHIADVKVECNSQEFVETHHSGRTTVGGFGKSFGMGYMMGGRSTSVAQKVNEYFLEIRYQIEKNGPVATVVVPGGAERRVVEELYATIRRLEA
jgi:hypothetical protein